MIHREYKEVEAGEQRAEWIRRGERKEPKEMDPFSFMTTSISCTKIQMCCHDFPVDFSQTWGQEEEGGWWFWSGVWTTQHHQADRLGVKSWLELVWSS